MRELLLVLLATPLPAFLLAAFVGRAPLLMGLGSTVALAIPFVLAVSDPDGSCEGGSEECGLLLGDISPGEWFFLGVIGAAFLLAAWMVGVGLGALARRTRVR